MASAELKRAVQHALLWALLGAALWFSPFRAWGLQNLAVQLTLFISTAGVPALRTGRMSYVDIAWPLGLVAIGAQAFALGTGHVPRVRAVALAYAVQGGRMGVWGLRMWWGGHLAAELPRYLYQRRRWARRGVPQAQVPLEMQVEILVQAFANSSILAIPAALLAFDPTPTVSAVELAGAALWAAALLWEAAADAQKARWVAGQRDGGGGTHCDIGLWRLSRHPNYFGEWMVWNALIVAALPALWRRCDAAAPVTCACLGGGLLYVSRGMYTCLCYYTGAVPSEHYSAQKRPGYRRYQQTTNMFFPWPLPSPASHRTPLAITVDPRLGGSAAGVGAAAASGATQ